MLYPRDVVTLGLLHRSGKSPVHADNVRSVPTWLTIL